MFESSIVARESVSLRPGRRSKREGHPVRIAIIAWPPIVFLGATFAAAACLMGDCGNKRRIEARETRVGHSGTVRSIAYRSDGMALSSVGADGSILIWGLTRRVERPFVPEGSAQVRAAAFSPDNCLLATANLAGTVVLHDLSDGQSYPLDDPTATTTGAACLAFAPDGGTLLIGQQDGRITLWNTDDRSLEASLSGHDEFIASMALSHDGRALATSGGDHLVRIWEMPSGLEQLSIPTPARTFCALAISPDGRLLALGDQVNPVVRIWNLTTGQQDAVLQGVSGAVVALAIDSVGSTLAAADLKGLITFWDLATLEIRPSRLRHGGVRTLAFAPDGHALATGGFDGTVHVWDFPIVEQ
jgi:WD40 repeat protein